MLYYCRGVPYLMGMKTTRAKSFRSFSFRYIEALLRAAHTNVGDVIYYDTKRMSSTYIAPSALRAAARRGLIAYTPGHMLDGGGGTFVILSKLSTQP